MRGTGIWGRVLLRGRSASGLRIGGAVQLQGTAAQREAEANPDYDDWLDEVERAVDTLASAFRIREETLTSADFAQSVTLPGGQS